MRFGAGVYVCYSIRLKSLVTLYLEPGAIPEPPPRPQKRFRQQRCSAASPASLFKRLIIACLCYFMAAA